MFRPDTTANADESMAGESLISGLRSYPYEELRRERNPDVDHQPVPPDKSERVPVQMPPDQPGTPEEGEPDPPPRRDPPENEPTRVLARDAYKTKPLMELN